MYSRLTTFALAALFLYGLAFAAHAQPADKDAKKLISEYFGADSSQPRRAEIIEKLKGINPELARKDVAAAIKKDDMRPRALELATAVRLTGLIKDLKKPYEGLDRAAITAWAMEVRDSEGILFLFQRWTDASADSDEYRELCDAFKKWHVPVEVLDKFQAKLKDAARGKMAHEILCWQLDVQNVSAEDLSAGWQKYRAEFVRNTTVFPIKGVDLFKCEGWTKTNVTELGTNWYFDKDGYADNKDMPGAGGTQPFTVTFRIAVLEGDGGQVGVFCGTPGKDSKGFPLVVNGDNWEDPASPSLKCPLKRGQWQEVRYEMSPQKGSSWRVDVYVDNKQFSNNGLLSAEPKSIQFSCSGCKWIVGGVDLKRQEKK